MKKPEIKKIADRIIARLKEQGFTIQRYDAYSTNSIYLKLDYGLCKSIRISTHAGKKHLKYAFNVIRSNRERRLVKDGNVWRQYFNFKEVDDLVKSVLERREWVKERYYKDYINDMLKAREQNEGKKGFWEGAVLL